MAEQEPLKFYIAGIDGSVDKAYVHKSIAESAENHGAEVLNRHRAEKKEYATLIKEEGLNGDLRKSWPKIKDAQAYAAFFGSKEFQTGVELGRLYNVPGVIFVEHNGFNIPIELVTELAEVVSLPSRSDRDLIDAHVQCVISRGREHAQRQRLAGKNDPSERINLADNPELFINGDLILDLAKKTAVLAGRPIAQLTPYQFSVLTQLSAHLDTVVETEELIKVVNSPIGDFDITTERNRVSNAIARINTMLQDRRYIESFKSIGYRMNDMDRVNSIAPNGTLQNGDLTINLTTGNIILEGREISVGQNVLRLLTKLMVHKGEVVPTNDVLDYVWGGKAHLIAKNNKEALAKQANAKLGETQRGYRKRFIRAILGKGFLMPNYETEN